MLFGKSDDLVKRFHTDVMLDLAGVSPENAVADACKIEHDISVESFEKIVAFAKERGLIDEVV